MKSIDQHRFGTMGCARAGDVLEAGDADVGAATTLVPDIGAGFACD